MTLIKNRKNNEYVEKYINTLFTDKKKNLKKVTKRGKLARLVECNVLSFLPF